MLIGHELVQWRHGYDSTLFLFLLGYLFSS